jgi:hypothetical protein
VLFRGLAQAFGIGGRGPSGEHAEGMVAPFRKDFARFLTQTNELMTKKQAKFAYSIPRCTLAPEKPPGFYEKLFPALVEYDPSGPPRPRGIERSFFPPAALYPPC